MLTTLLLFADDPPKGGGDPFSAYTMLLPLLAIGVLFYFMMLRPMRKQEAERKSLVDNLKKNDKVLTSAGILGTVIGVSETEDEVTVKVDDNTRLKMIKSSIVKNITQEEALKAQKEQKAAK
jgi:preprotein translocase subunit YajC